MLPPKRVHINSLIIQVQYTPLFVIFIILQDFVLLNIVKNLNSEEFNNCSFDILLFGAYRKEPIYEHLRPYTKLHYIQPFHRLLIAWELVSEE